MMDFDVRVIKSAIPEADSLERRMVAALNREMQYLASAAAKRAPVAGGQLRRSIGGFVDRDAGVIEAGLGMAPTWPYVEFGTGPHRNPTPRMPVYLTDEAGGTGSIERWLIQKGIAVGGSHPPKSDQARRSLAFLIARKIRKHGTKAQPFLRPALQARRDNIARAIARVLRGER